jgi:asparagine synthase (glutamine-hydrolysing)
MCGICGKLNVGSHAPRVTEESIHRMLSPISHRGPDAEGVFISDSLGLGHKRLKIIDLVTGKQPMCNENGTVWITFNGEIYNYRELAAFLVKKGHQFKSTSDTEVIVHLYEEYGEDCVKHLCGMFSFALWDDINKTLFLARDRVGIKPLYYSLTGTSFLFASEVKAIIADPSVQAEVDPKMIDRFLTYFYMPGDQTIFKSIKKLEPGHSLTVRNGDLKITQYWDLTFSPVERSLNEAVEELEHLLSRTVRDHMISDVPVGVLLSGGVDSSGVLGFAVENTHKSISTFTAGFDGGCTDERPFARIAAKAFGAQNYEISISPQEFWNFLPKYVWHMEEPVCEPPAIALYYVSKLAREHVTVLLSGEGGDEAFGGYQSHRNFYWFERLKQSLGPLASVVKAVGSTVGNKNSRYGKYCSLMRTPLEDYYYSHSSGPYEFFNSHYRELYTKDFLATIDADSRAHLSQRLFSKVKGLDPLDQMLYVDTKTWLPDDLLIKADKMTMANSLELRVPLLDHRILEFAGSLPRSYKLNNLNGKHILKMALSKRVPPEILHRKKAGFPVPYAAWLNNELRDQVSEVLLDESTIARGYFRRDAVEKMINAPRSEKRSKEVFSLVVLELWHRMFLENNVCNVADEAATCISAQ